VTVREGGAYGPLLDTLRALRWPARRPVAGGAPGAHAARARGSAVEFSEYRPYRQGDDPRRLDWKLLARSDRAFIRLSPDRAVLRTIVVVDASASMAFPAGSLAKWAQARRLAVGLAAVAHGQGDPLGARVATSPPRLLAPRTRRGVVGELATVLDEVVPAGSPAMAPLLATLAGTERLLLVTDLLGDADALLAAAARHVAAGGEVTVVHVVSREELDPPAGALLAVDPEDASIRRSVDDAARAGYMDAFAEWRAATARAWRAAGARHVLVQDDEPAERAVRRIVAGTSSERGT
jgi:uncharacterized protein (DUF58 family)